MDNKHSKELMHFSLGEIFSNHKYIRREENTDGQKSKFRYFYDNIKSSVTNAISSFADNWKAGIPKSVKESVSSFTSNVYNKIQTGNKTIENLGSSS
jgi:ABC-type transporter lipoprotein component MlaA